MTEEPGLERRDCMRYLNGFILIGIILFFISIAGLVKGNTLLTEPGQPVNPYAWLEYLAASALMLVNGAVSIWTHRQQEEQRLAEAQAKRAAETAAANEPTVTEVPIHDIDR